MRVFVVLTGSCAWMRSLAFSHAPRHPDRFPLYECSKQNLNSERYLSSDFATLSSMQDVATYMECSVDSEVVSELFFLTAGNIGKLRMAISNRGGLNKLLYTMTGKFVAKYSSLLELLREASGRSQQEQGGDLTKAFPWFVDTPVEYLKEVDADGKVTDKILYEAADFGAIIFNDEQQLVRFATPALAGYVGDLSSTRIRLLDSSMRLCLGRPDSKLGD